jgi:ribosomal-protein-alanine N-acetyltransferase
MHWWDVAAAHALESDLFPDPWSVETFWSELAHVPESRHYLVAEADGTLVSTAAQGRGLGRALLDALLAEARRREANEVLLEVRAENTAAQALYARAGFERIAIRRGYYRPGNTDALVLRLHLRRDGAAADPN